jgi:hypothetical protein
MAGIGLYPQYNDPARGREIGRGAGLLEKALIAMQMASAEKRQAMENEANLARQKMQSASMERGQDISLQGTQAEVEARKKAAEMQYGFGGASDREARARERMAEMQYGPEGAYDRHNLSQESIAAQNRLAEMDKANIAADANKYGVDAQKPYWEGIGSKALAEADEKKESTAYDIKANPFRLVAEKSKLGYDTAVTENSLKELNKPKIAETPVAAPKSPEQVVSPYQQQIKEIKQWRPTGLRPTDAIAQVGSYLGHTLKYIPKSIYDYLTYR